MQVTASYSQSPHLYHYTTAKPCQPLPHSLAFSLGSNSHTLRLPAPPAWSGRTSSPCRVECYSPLPQELRLISPGLPPAFSQVCSPDWPQTCLLSLMGGLLHLGCSCFLAAFLPAANPCLTAWGPFCCCLSLKVKGAPGSLLYLLATISLSSCY